MSMNNRFKPEAIKPELPTREMLLDLPLLNRLLLGGGATLIAFGFLSTIGPPVASEVRRVSHPYTSQGKEETCLANLRALGSALETYRESHNGRYPALETVAQNKDGKSRTTWASLLRLAVPTADLSCPSGGGDGMTTSGYAFNAALSDIAHNDIPNPENVIVLADRGETHDIALLPPLEGWRPANSQAADGQSAPTAAQSSNLDFRHSRKVGVLFADGHVEMREEGEWMSELQNWGGTVAISRARTRIVSLHPLLQRMENIAEQGDKNLKRDGAAVKLMREEAGKSKAFEKAMQAVWGLWVQNDPTAAEGASFDAETDAWGWKLAKWSNRAGQPGFLQFFDKEQSRRSQVILEDAKRGAQDSAWQKYEGRGFTIAAPENWTRQEEQDGRYLRTYFRSLSPHIGVQIERGERIKPGPEAGIEWAGMEADFKRTYGERYQRISMGETTLAGEAASVWEFEIERKDAPRLRKLYVGRSRAWDSVVFTATAPARDFALWKPLFEQSRMGCNAVDGLPDRKSVV